jgi:hypothetical protein
MQKLLGYPLGFIGVFGMLFTVVWFLIYVAEHLGPGFR